MTNVVKESTVVKAIREDHQFNNIELDLGEYFLHVYIQYSQNLELSDVSDIRMEINSMNQSQYSQIQKKVTKSSHTFWGEHFFFTKHYQTREELNNDVLQITIYTHSLVDRIMDLSKSKVGSFQISLLKIYSGQDHILLDDWNILTNPQKSYHDIMGFVRLSVNFVRVGEPRADLEQLQKRKLDEDFNTLEFPPNIRINKK